MPQSAFLCVFSTPACCPSPSLEQTRGQTIWCKNEPMKNQSFPDLPSATIPHLTLPTHSPSKKNFSTPVKSSLSTGPDQTRPPSSPVPATHARACIRSRVHALHQRERGSASHSLRVRSSQGRHCGRHRLLHEGQVRERLPIKKKEKKRDGYNRKKYSWSRHATNHVGNTSPA